MHNDLLLRGMATRTRAAYIAAVARLARHYRRSPDRISEREVQVYLLHLIQDEKLSWSTCNVAVHGLRFFYHTTLGRERTQFTIPASRQPCKLPAILSREEVVRLFEATTNQKHRTVLVTTYAAGLRVSEVVRLQLTDIDANRMSLRVEAGKGTAQKIYYAARDRARIAKLGGIHALRHAFATHLLESGTDLHTIQRLLGHGHIGSTMRYLHLAQKRLMGNRSPLDLLDLPPRTS
jgi:site-specific recombinase XerD